MLNRYSLWKYLLMVALLLVGVIYALPNLYGDNYAVQISPKEQATITQTTIATVKKVLQQEKLPYINISREDHTLLVRFKSASTQLKAQDVIQATVGDNYSVAINLAPRTPKWLLAIGAEPMKLGLDLRGGVHFLLNVDVEAVIKAREDGDIRSMADALREDNVRYASISRLKPQGIIIHFRNQKNLDQAYSALPSKFRGYIFSKHKVKDDYRLRAIMTTADIINIRNYAVDQTMSILRTRVNDLGVAEAVIQRQGKDNISVDLPGVQNTARAKNIIGKTATLKFQMVDVSHDLQSALAGNVPLGSSIYYDDQGKPILLKNRVILRGSSITYATATMGPDGRPAVNVRLGGGGESLFHRVTAANVGKPMAVVYVESKLEKQMIDGKPTTVRKQVQRVISVATIQSALGNNFIIQGLNSQRYAHNLALLLRSGAYQAPVNFIQERTVGPSLGKENIHRGVVSLIVGSLLVIFFMAFYYRLFGLVADLALTLNVIFIAAILSIVGATLTLAGMAGIVLTVGMAVDANVLINERIREELRHGVSPQASIHAGYERAFSTIIDANLTTLIVAIVLFALGSDTVKGFAVVLTIGLLTSMVTSIFFTRGVINLIYGGRSVKRLSIGIRQRTS